MTADRATSKRRAVSALARKYGIRANDVYDAIENAKKSGKRPS